MRPIVSVRRVRRVLLLLLCTTAILSATPARAEIVDLLRMLQPNLPVPRGLGHSSPRPLQLNGFPLQMVSGRAPETPRQILDSYQARYRDRHPGRLPSPAHREDGDDYGVLITVDGSGDDLLRRMAATRQHYLHLAPLCLVFAQQAGELTDYLAVWSDTPLPRSVLAPPPGQDAPGSDVPGVPRPVGSLRSFSLREPAAGYAIVSYVVDAPAPNALSSVINQLRSEGFAVDGTFGTAARATGQLLLRLERPGRDLLVSAHPHAASADRSLIVYLTRSR